VEEFFPVPLYEYQCTACGHRFEKIQSFTSPELSECPVCKGKLERPLSAPAFQFKGAGWYVTDYAGKGGTTKNSSDKSTENKASASETGTTPQAATQPANAPPAASKAE
jgi:putative FmdB family regulatory protein